MLVSASGALARPRGCPDGARCLCGLCFLLISMALAWTFLDRSRFVRTTHGVELRTCIEEYETGDGPASMYNI